MPRLVDHAQRRRHLAAAACAVVTRAGLAGLTMRDVAVEARCTTGMVTHYFDDKRQLLLAALEEATRAVGERILARVQSAPDEPGHQRAFVRSVLEESLPLDEVRRNEWRIWIAYWGAAINDDALHVEHVERYDRWRRALVLVLDGAGFDADGAAQVAEALMIAVDGIGVHATFDPAAWPPQRQLAELDRNVDALVGPLS
jgi:TetR/AcrR family transcriptional repressor of bet genes